MKQNRLYLKTPKINELEYRIKLMADADTMEYNIGYGVNGTGCYFSTQEEEKKWYKDWFSDPKRFYAYVTKLDDGMFVGDVNIHFDNNCDMYMVGIVIEASKRGNGYAEEALILLAKKAFYELRIDKIADDFPKERIAAEKVFKKVGFIRKSDNLLILTKEDFENLCN